ncbi:DinB family protein [Comamonas serinivorans]|uniref:DinB family protein n=1 Tax=Comamonas serinivorans TaxID=1082851 RepID=UPI001F3799A9|nr:DinB family protein [Comamonas serinivorans]
MMTTDTAVMLARYSDWADQTLFSAMAALPAGAIAQPRQTLFQSMIGTLNHNHVVDLIWRAHLLGQTHGFSTRRDVLYPQFTELVAAQTALNQWYLDWAGNKRPTA